MGNIKTTNWGILGTGTIAHLFTESLLSLSGAKIHAVAGRGSVRANEFAAQYRISHAFGDYEPLLQESAVEVVYIATPNESHYEYCLKALKAGKAVLCEKPFTLTASEAAEVIDLARSRGLFCMEAMWMRFAPAVRDALQLARQGQLGKLQFYSAQLGFPYSGDNNSRLFRKPGGGALLDLGVYPLALAQALFGSPAQVESSVEMAPSGVDEQVVAVLSYDGGAQAAVAASLKAKLTNSASIHGSCGVLHLEEPLYFPERYRIVSTPAHSTRQRGSRRSSRLRRLPLLRNIADLRNNLGVRSISKRTSASGYSFEAAEVQRCLQAGLLESPEMPLADTLAVMNVIESIRSEWADKLPS